MFKKVLVAEDMDSVTHAVTNVLSSLNIDNYTHAQYCDTAFVMAKKAILDGEPFDLLICDLSFKLDHRLETITTGQQLISKLKREDPKLKVLVNSIEDHPNTIKKLKNSGNINGYVCKDRNGMKELKKAILAIYDGKMYLSPNIESALKQENTFSIKDFEIQLLTYISKGWSHDEIEQRFKEKNISPNSKSAIEKRLKELKDDFNAKTTPHLISIVKDLKLI